MAIDPGTVTAATHSAAPKAATTAKASGGGDSDFSRTLATSRAARDHNQQTQHSGHAAPHDDAAHPSDARANGPQHDAKQAAGTTTAAGDKAKERDASAHDAGPTSADKHEHITRQRLSASSLLAAQTSAPKKAADKTQPPVASAGGRPASTRPETTAAQAQTAAATRAETKTAALDNHKRRSSGPGNAASDHKTHGKTHDKAHHQSKKTDSPGPIAALIQAPLITTQTIKPGRAAQGSVGDAASGRPSVAASLHASWQQLYARLEGHGASHGQSNNPSGSQAGGDSPAQLLAALTANDQTGASATGSPDGGPRPGLLHAAGSNASQGANGIALAGVAGQGLQSAAAPQAAAAHTGTAATTASLNAPIASDDWNQALGQHTLRLAGAGGQQQAQIQLHPRELGQINISVTVNSHNQAQLHFAAAHAHVREAVEAALPQLRQALAAGGLSLGQASVGDQNSQAAFAGGDGRSDSRGGKPGQQTAAIGDISADTALDAGAQSIPLRDLHRPGGIDIFA